MTKLDKKGFFSLFEEAENILITTHIKPDADAMGSSLALYLFLKSKGKNVKLFLPSDYPDFYNWFPGINEVEIFKKEKTQLDFIKKADLFFAVDFNQLKRIEELGKEIEKHNFAKVVIDHHPDKPDIYQYEYWSTKSAAAAEEVANFIRDIDAEYLNKKDIASCLYAALIADTGSFKYPSVSDKTHALVAELLKSGIDHTAIHRKIYDNFNLNRLKLWGYAMDKKLKIYPELELAIISLSKKDFENYGCDIQDSEGLVNYPHVLNEIEISVLIYERDKGCKLSFRSKTSFPVNEIAFKHFNGGGHFHAAGGESDLGIDEIEDMVVEVLKAHQEKV
jgi:phosphoesterase RecJ-like protein